jgi:hypothetical protein
MKNTIFFVAALACLSTPVTAENPQEAFVKAWTGQPVLVKSPLYSLIFNERGALGNMKSGEREGLLVITPSSGSTLQFNGRQGRDTVNAGDPQQLVDKVREVYAPDALDIRAYRKVEPLAINRFEAGVELVVGGVRVGRDEVTLEFVPPGGGKEAVTSIRAKWPLPFSKSFTERPLLDNLLRRFIEQKQ